MQISYISPEFLCSSGYFYIYGDEKRLLRRYFIKKLCPKNMTI